MLYELLTSQPAFRGESIAESIGATLHAEPPLSALPAATPPLVRLVLRQCLEKNRARRLRDAGDARLALESAVADPTAGGVPSEADGHASSRARRVRIRSAIALAAIGLIATAVLFALWMRRPVTGHRTPVIAFDIAESPGLTLASFSEQFPPLGIDAAGERIVLAYRADGVTRLYLRHLSETGLRPLAGTEGATAPFFSPDGRWIGFFASGRLQKIPVGGGPALTICETAHGCATWMEDGTIVISAGPAGLWRVDANGGTARRIVDVEPDGPAEDGRRRVLGFNRVERVPGARRVLASIWDGDTLEHYAIVSVSMDDGSIRPVLSNATDGRFIVPSWLLFQRDDSLFAAPFDPDGARVTGEAVRVIEGMSISRWADAAYLATSPAGTIAFVPGGRPGPGRRLLRVAPDGTVTPLMDQPQPIVGGVGASPDGRYAALLLMRRRLELWLFDLERRSLSVISREGEAWSPVWTPDGTALLFLRRTTGRAPEIVRQSIVADTPAEVLPVAATPMTFPDGLTTDGEFLIFSQHALDQTANADILRVRLQPGATPEPLIATAADEFHGRLSPDGRWLAFQSNESGRLEISLRSMAPPHLRVRVSSGGGTMSRWSSDGRTLFFLGPEGVLFAAAIDVDAGSTGVTARAVRETREIATTDTWGAFDVLPDGSFLLVQPAPWEREPRVLRVMAHRGSDLARMIPAHAGR